MRLKSSQQKEVLGQKWRTKKSPRTVRTMTPTRTPPMQPLPQLGGRERDESCVTKGSGDGAGSDGGGEGQAHCVSH